MAVKVKRESPISPVLFKFGVALALSLGGVVYSLFRSKMIKPSMPKLSLASPGKDSEVDSRGESGQLQDDDRSLQDFSPLNASSQNSINDLSSSGRCSGDRDGLLLPEFDELISECDMAHTKDENDIQSPKKYNKEHETEISSLRNKVKLLEERERILETQLLEYYGLKEQESVVLELQNRVKLHNMESKLYNLKIESLKSDKRRLEAQVADYAEVVTELEAAKAKIKLLRKKLTSEAEHNRAQILSLQERVMKLKDQETKDVEIDQELGMAEQRRKELEAELEEVKKSNHSLKLENYELTEKLENMQTVATSALDHEEVQALKEENQLLRHQNEDLRTEIEQLQADRCTDIEELVYLRWINACLRYEMRNYQPSPGKTIARDLSKTLSPQSEKKAKQLILEYATREGSTDNISDFDSFSYLTDHDDLPLDISSAANKTRKRAKVFAKLMKLFRGKDGQSHNIQTPITSTLERAVSVDDIVSRYSLTKTTTSWEDSLTKTTTTSWGDSPPHSFDLQRPLSRDRKSSTGESSNCSRRASDDGGSLSILRRIDSLGGYDGNLSPGHREDARNSAKAELAKFAEALKNSRGKPSFRRRAASFSS